MDTELPDPDSFPTLLQLVKEKRVSEATIDQAVARNLRAKFLLGLFENPYVDVERAVRVTNSSEHRALAAEAARRSITLLKNAQQLVAAESEYVEIDRSYWSKCSAGSSRWLQR